jgi:methylaspartate mutase sigma subunit
MTQKWKGRLVVGTIGHDAHIIGGYVITYALREAGYQVTHLGAMVSQEEFINAAVETQADAILVSSLYGMGIMDCEGFRESATEAGLKDIRLYAGGILTTDDRPWEETHRRFKEMGFTRAYPPGTLPETFIADLEKDLAQSPA